MTEWVIVNGARIERTFLEANVAEARSYTWKRGQWDEPGEHGHCMICSISISEGDMCYHCKEGQLCPYCYERFVATTE